MRNEDDQKENFGMKVCIMEWIGVAFNLFKCMNKLWLSESIVPLFSMLCDPCLSPVSLTAGIWGVSLHKYLHTSFLSCFSKLSYFPTKSLFLLRFSIPFYYFLSSTLSFSLVLINMAYYLFLSLRLSIHIPTRS